MFQGHSLITSPLIDAYVVVSRYVDQLDEERSANSVVVPRTMVREAGGPQVTTYAAPTYPFADPQQAFGTTRGQNPSNMV